MIIPGLAVFDDLALFILRLLIAAVFGTSGWSHLTKPSERSAEVGLPVPATALLGAVELVGAVALALGAYVQIAAIMLICVMLGAIYKKMFVWKTGFWGEKSNGWYYDSLYLACNLVFLTFGAGSIAIL